MEISSHFFLHFTDIFVYVFVLDKIVLVTVCVGTLLSKTVKLFDSIHLVQHLSLAPEISERNVVTLSVPHISQVAMHVPTSTRTYGLGLFEIKYPLRDSMATGSDAHRQEESPTYPQFQIFNLKSRD